MMGSKWQELSGLLWFAENIANLIKIDLLYRKYQNQKVRPSQSGAPNPTQQLPISDLKKTAPAVAKPVVDTASPKPAAGDDQLLVWSVLDFSAPCSCSTFFPTSFSTFFFSVSWYLFLSLPTLSPSRFFFLALLSLPGHSLYPSLSASTVSTPCFCLVCFCM